MTSKSDKAITKQPLKPDAKPRRAWKPKFLEALRESANVCSACRAARVSRPVAYLARKADPAFAAAWDIAIEDACDLLELEARRRAYEGTDKPISYQGKVTATYKEYSDTLLMFLLRAHRPQKFAEQHRSENLNLDLSTLNDKQLELLANGASLTTVLAAASAGGSGAQEE